MVAIMTSEQPESPILDDGLSRRLKALACTAPLHDLDNRKSHVDWADAAKYQMAEIGLQIIDQVTIAMDFDRGADHQQVIARTVPFIALQATDRDTEEHRRVAQWVLDNLINVGTPERGFTAVYGSFDAGGRYQKRAWSFRLLVELVDAGGEVYLRATDEAINVLVGALDTDVESAQEAAETKLASLVRRGRLSDAQLAAEQARWRTIQYADLLRRQLDATRRDVRAVDWLHEVPDLIGNALTHIEARFQAENAIITNITIARDEAEDPARKRKAAELVTIVRECIRRHTQLQARLQQAGATFRFEQDRQQFTGPARRGTVDLFGHLLVPLLGLPVRDAKTPVAEFFRAASGLAVPALPRLMDLTYMLLAPPVERDDLLGDIPDPDLVPAGDPPIFPEDLWLAADRILDLGEVPQRLSGLLAEARAEDPTGLLAHLVALRVFHAINPDIHNGLRDGEQYLLVAVDDRTPLLDPQFGGADLMIGRGALDPTGFAVPPVDQDTHHEPDGAGTDAESAAGVHTNNGRTGTDNPGAAVA
jgi:hypothetical protein